MSSVLLGQENVWAWDWANAHVQKMTAMTYFTRTPPPSAKGEDCSAHGIRFYWGERRGFYTYEDSERASFMGCGRIGRLYDTNGPGAVGTRYECPSGRVGIYLALNGRGYRLLLASDARRIAGDAAPSMTTREESSRRGSL
jgi:hypothetical protein